jgi:ABC-type phosphate transport system substrate-binding protein
MPYFIRTRRSVAMLLAVALISTAAVRPVSTAVIPDSIQTPGDVAVIAHPDVPIADLSRADLRRMLLGDREFWAPGLRVTLFIRAPIARERDVAVQDICEMTEAQFRQHWIAKVFRADTPTGPKIVYSADMAVDQVSRTPGAIGFVAAAQAAGKNVKILRIDGRAPGQSGYRLK